ncbi:hypothetical protein Tco_0586737 [Tanacetum coccineum]
MYVLRRLIDDLLALDSKVRFDISDRRLELTATFSIPTYSDGSGGSVDVVSVVYVTLEGTSADAVRALKICLMQMALCYQQYRGTERLRLIASRRNHSLNRVGQLDIHEISSSFNQIQPLCIRQGQRDPFHISLRLREHILLVIDDASGTLRNLCPKKNGHLSIN